ncbi:MAG: hypothetical protein RLZZ479_1565 [Bacteroidota bacterium]|jgi:hypothetical protein
MENINCENNHFCEVWELTVIDEYENGYLVIAPTGETAWMSYQEYELYLENSKKDKTLF